MVSVGREDFVETYRRRGVRPRGERVIPMPEEISRRLVPGKRLAQLLSPTCRAVSARGLAANILRTMLALAGVAMASSAGEGTVGKFGFRG